MAAAWAQNTQGKDSGMCLSMHQPWASLLVYGIKRIEGKGWPTDHRGRLWIAATAKPPLPQEIQELEAFYRTVHALDGGQPGPLAFPPAYPTGVLVGCVDVVGCLQAERAEASEGLPDSLRAEVGSPFCFLCQNAQRLVVLHPMRGQPKLFRLDGKIHKAAQLGLKPAPNGQGLDWEAFGAPPAFSEQLPPSQRPTKQGDAGGGTNRGAGQRGTAAAAGGATNALADGCQPSHAAAARLAGSPAAASLPQSGALQQQQSQQPQDPEKRLRAVQKKLRQIAALEQKRRSGSVQLLPEELAKLEQMGALEAEALQLQAAQHKA